MKKKFLGFGFGAIQGGLLLYEAFESGAFDDLAVAEVLPEVVAALRTAGGVYRVNIAGPSGITQREVCGVTACNPHEPEGRRHLIELAAEADEFATALPSVQFYGDGEPGSVVDIIAEGLKLRRTRLDDRCSIVYTAENNNHAAEILLDKLERRLGAEATWAREHLQCLNTVIGKMSGVVTDPAQIREQNLAPLTPAAGRCLLVEAFNRILITRITLPGFQRGIAVFTEKDDLLPFEEAKLYGHNATHALMGYLGRLKGFQFMADATADTGLINLARAAFIEESGRALCDKHAGVDDLFTPVGYAVYADDLIERMLNPYLRDAVDRVVRDPMRKLGWNDRLIGTIRLVLSRRVQPERYALGAAAAMRMLAEQTSTVENDLREQWKAAGAQPEQIQRVMDIIKAADADMC